MSRQIRHVAAGMLVLFAALLLNVNYLQVIRAEELASDTRNARQLIREYEIQRGLILAADAETELARSEETDDVLRYLRRYPSGPLYAHVTGFYSFVYGREQLEQTFNDFLVGSAPETFARNLTDLLAGRERNGDDVVTTILPAAQRAASEALGDRRGAVLALAPGTGEILALVSRPTYDPNRLSSHDRDEIVAYREQLLADPGNPLANRGTIELFPPGSTFKLVTAAAALEHGFTPTSTFDDPPVYVPPLTTAGIRNFGGGLCNGGNPLSFAQALAVSCNTTFAQLGVELGAEALIAQAEAFGFNMEWDFQLPHNPGSIPKELDPPATAQSAIGQRDVLANPLQMAMVSGAIANDGLLMTPRVVKQVNDYEGRILRQYPPEPLRLPSNDDGRVMAVGNAEALTQMMVGVVSGGSGTNAAIPGVTVAGKTGTAQTAPGRNPTVWFTGFAPAESPQVAVAVVVEDGGDIGSEATGGAVAAPIARAVLEAVLAAA